MTSGVYVRLDGRLAADNYALVDFELGDWAREYSWNLTTHGYARRSVRGRKVYLHRIVCDTSSAHPNVDHINGDKLDNRSCNLRACTQLQNSRNRISTNLAGLKGVSFDKSRGLWQAGITVNYKRKALGRFSSPEEAHAAYCKAAKELHGEFAKV